MGFLRKIKTFFKLIGFLLILALLAVVGFAAGVYFQIIDSEQTAQVNEALSLYKLPFVGQYFDVPEGVEWTKEDAEKATDDFVNTVTTGINTGLTSVTDVAEQLVKPEEPPPPKKSKEVKVSQKEIERQMQEREAAEKKRISKLARVYTSMKPDAAAEAIGNLDSDTAVLIFQKMEDDAVAQILAKMDPFIAAQITELMLQGPRQRNYAPPPQPQPEEEAEPEVESAYVDTEATEEEYYGEEEYVEPEYYEGEAPEGVGY